MSIYSHRMPSSRFRDSINLTSSTMTRQQRHLWICSQIHSRILMIILSLVILINNFTKLHEASWGQFFIAYALLFGAITGIWALKLVDNTYQKDHRVKKHYCIPPKFIIIPSYIVQIGFIILFAYETFHYLVTKISSFMELSPLFVLFGVLIPIWLIWIIILYVFAAEINCFIYVVNRSRHWRSGQYPLLNMRTSNNARRPFNPTSSRKHLATDTLQERERTKLSDSVAIVNSGSRKTYNNTETRIEVIPSIHATEKMAPCFSEYSRMGISMISSQLETVPEESSKSTNSLP
ncbi:unnamed protein product [Cercopithifilaria johnstoni]|uniref:Uncharacterized protein n=1 Tax=Cercopithifilaria johnstoni TaxID=2874296 RepID=A0A8J2MCT8_9BILA|nr:unnamed protein product [Cercopithifilaria johnstoni]